MPRNLAKVGFVSGFVLVIVVVTMNCTMNTVDVDYLLDQARMFTKCPPIRKKELMESPLSLDAEGNVGLKEVEDSSCFVVNSTEVGIYRIFDRRNFKGTQCQPVRKRFLSVTTEDEVRTALYSIPGSGNTWTRHLIEEITGIYTGSIYGDQTLKPTFKGEDTIHNVSAIKTHDPDFEKYDRVVVIIRDPFESSLAEFNRQLAGQTHFPGEETFKTKDFGFFLDFRLKGTVLMHSIQNFKGDLFILYYDKLITDLPNSLIKLATFLKYKMTLERLWCTVVNKEGSYRRKGDKPDYMSRAVLVNDTTEERIKQWKQNIQTALGRRKLLWSTN